MSRKKALYQYEFGNMKWFLVAGLVCCALVLLFENGLCEDFRHSTFVLYWSFNGQFIDLLPSATMAAIFAVSIMVVFQFSDYHKRSRREYISSLPFTQRERFVAKYVMGSGILTTVCIVFGVGILLLRNKWFPYCMKSYLTSAFYKVQWGNDTWFQSLRSILLLWITMLMVYTIFTLVHSLITHGVVACVAGIGAIFTPIVIFHEISFYVYRFGQVDVMSNEVVVNIRQVLQAFYGRGYNKSIDADVSTYGCDTFIDYGCMTMVFAVLIAVLLVCFCIAYWVNVRQDSAKYGVLVVAKWARVMVSAGVAICFSHLIAIIADGLLEATEWASKASGIFVLIVQAATIVPIFFVSMLISKRVMK